MSMITWFGCKMKRPDFKIEDGDDDKMRASWTFNGVTRVIVMPKSEGRLALVQEAHKHIIAQDEGRVYIVRSLDRAFPKKQKRTRRKAA